MRNAFLPFALPDIGEDEIREVVEVLRSGWITTGQRCRDFETQFAAKVGAKFAVAVNSCTAAMHLALEAIGTKAGDHIVTTPYTFAATAEVIRYFGATPRFVDVDPVSLNMSPRALEQAVAGARAVIPVHFAGVAAEMPEIRAIAARAGCPVIEDAAHAFPSVDGDGLVGAQSEMTCFSFYATKTITTAEGGMLVTNDQKTAERVRIMSLHGISRDAWKRYREEGTWYYEILDAGYKYNLTDVAAAMGLAQLRRADQMRQRRQDIAAIYDRELGQLGCFELPYRRTMEGHAWHLYPLRLDLAQFQCDRARFIEELKAHKIGTSVHFIPLHIHPYYRDLLGLAPEALPHAYGQYLREVSLPIYSSMSDADVQDVVQAVTTVAKEQHR